MHDLRALAVVAVSLLCGGCALQIVDGRKVQVVVSDGLTNSPTFTGVRDLRSLMVGGWVVRQPHGQGVESLGMGLRRTRRLEIPSECRLVIIVPSEAVLKRVQESGIVEEGNHTCALLE